MKHRLLLVLSILLTQQFCGFGQTRPVAEDLLGIPATISFNGRIYKLGWSSHPSKQYYKEEYLPETEKAETFSHMLLFDLLESDATLQSFADAKLGELREMKKTNPYVDFKKVSTGQDERMIDFVITANNADGSISIIERNVYRYKIITTGSGQKSVLMFGASERAYAADVVDFRKKLAANRDKLVSAVRSYQLPAIHLSK